MLAVAALMGGHVGVCLQLVLRENAEISTSER